MIEAVHDTKLLCGDDGRSWLADLALDLGRYGRCELAADGPAVIQAFTTALETPHPYRMVCLGADLTGMTSLDTLRELRAVEAGRNRFGREACPVVLFAERQDKHHVFACFRAQCEGYLVKPFESHRLHRLMADLGIPPLTAP